MNLEPPTLDRFKKNPANIYAESREVVNSYLKNSAVSDKVLDVDFDY